jgi:hypothetical protein
VLAAGLNAGYHDGGLQWAHRVADRVERHSAAVLALASGGAERLVSETRLLAARDETASCRLATAMARVQTRIAQSRFAESEFAQTQAGLDAMTAREEAQAARFEANRARIEARIAARTAHIRIATAVFTPISVKAMAAPVVCPRVRVNVPRVPMVRIPVIREIHIESGSAGPV